MQSGLVGLIALFGIAWLADTWIGANEAAIVDAMGGLVEQWRWAIAIAIFIVAALTTSQAAALAAIIPIGLALGVPPQFLAAFSTAGLFIPFDRIGMVLDLGFHFAGTVLLLMLPLVVLLAALQSMVAAFAKSYREAQTYLSILMIIPVLPSAMLSVLPIKAVTWMYAVPLLGQNLGIIKVLRGQMVTGQELGLVLASGFAAAAVAIGVTAWLYRSERLAISG